MTASSFVTLLLPPAFIGEAYEAAIGVAAPTNVTVLTTHAGNDTGLPTGLIINADKQRVTGTPTGAASTPQGTGVALTGPGAYTFTLEPNTTDTGVSKQYTINVYSSRLDRSYLQSTTTAANVARLNMAGS